MNNLKEISKQIRIKCLEICHKHKASHLGGAFSVADILTVLYFDFLKVDAKKPKWEERDRLFYSKGHACTALYSALEIKGFYEGLKENFTINDSVFTSHVNNKVPGIELSTGSLGHALAVSCGVAMAGKIDNKNWNVVTIVSDGELNEGSNWEAILFAPHHKLDNLILIVDYNKIQSFGSIKEVLNLDSLTDKFKAFNWNTIEIDGHNFTEIKNSLQKSSEFKNSKPTAIIANTIKGKGVSFMENQLSWHYKSPNDKELDLAISEIQNP